jgi:hypothetical protein
MDEVLSEGTVTAGWMADCANRIPHPDYSIFDRIFYFDTFMKPFLKALYGDDARMCFLPLAVNENQYHNRKKERKNRLLFAGSCTEERLKMFHQLNRRVPLDVIGPKYRRFYGSMSGWRLSPGRLNNLYNRYAACLNVNQKPNTVNGLNFRPFEATAAGGLVFNEDVADLSNAFEPQKKIVTYRSIDELIEKFSSLSKDERKRRKIAESGRKRTLNEHTFTHRAEFIIKDLGLF